MSLLAETRVPLRTFMDRARRNVGELGTAWTASASVKAKAIDLELTILEDNGRQLHFPAKEVQEITASRKCADALLWKNIPSSMWQIRLSKASYYLNCLVFSNRGNIGTFF